MATATPIQKILEETKCTLCKGYLTDPVTIDCGHNLCQICLAQYRETWGEPVQGPLCCPRCGAPIQKGDLLSNQQLAKLVEKIKQLAFKQEKENMCKKHNRDLDLFRERVLEHRSHMLLLMEAAQKYEGADTDSRDEISRSGAESGMYPNVTRTQDVRSTLTSCKMKTLQQLLEISTTVDIETLSDFTQRTVALMETWREFKATVTLDPDTAHPRLILFEDGKSVKWANTPQDLPDTPERFDTIPCVLGCGGFTSGRHYWEVEVGYALGWAVGVARESVRRKGETSRSPEEGIWAVRRSGDEFWALTSPRALLPLSSIPTRIWVCLDCERGHVAFFDAGNKAPIFTFPSGSVPGGTLRPWLWVGLGPHLRMRP